MVPISTSSLKWLLLHTKKYWCDIASFRTNSKGLQRFCTLSVWVFNSNRPTAFRSSTATKPAHLAKYVGLVIDEMYVKEGLVFEKSTGSLVGYSDLEEVNNLLAEVEQHSKEPDTLQKRPLAKCMLVFMI